MKKHRKFLKDLQTSEQFYNDQESRQIIGELIAMIDEGFNKQKADWIPCEERLPEENTEVLINRNHNVFEISIGYYNKDFSWYDQCQCHMISDVTAWQPLPAPYKKGGAEDEL